MQLDSTDGEYRVRLTLTDAAGNSASTTSDPVTLDTTAPDPGPAPTVNGDGNVRSRTVDFTRDASTDAAEIELLDATNTIIQTVAVPTGASGTIQLPDTDGDYAVRVKQTDAAGNSTRSSQATVALDRVAPEAPTAPTAAGTPDALDVVFDRASDAVTVDVEVRAAGSSELLATIHVPTGNHATVTLPEAEGEYEITVVQTDQAGNSTTTPPLKVARKRAESEPQPQPETPAQPQAETSSRPAAPSTPAPAEQQPVRCPRSGVVLTHVALHGTRVNVSGWSARPTGTKVTITDLANKAIGTATIDGRGRFATVVDAPGTAAARRATGYRAVLDGAQSPAVMLQRGNKLTSVERSDATITLHGRIKAGHLGTVKQVRAYAKGACATGSTLLRPIGKLVVDHRAGTYTLRVAAPAGRLLIVSTQATGTKGSSTSVFQVR